MAVYLLTLSTISYGNSEEQSTEDSPNNSSFLSVKIGGENFIAMRAEDVVFIKTSNQEIISAANITSGYELTLINNYSKSKPEKTTRSFTLTRKYNRQIWGADNNNSTFTITDENDTHVEGTFSFMTTAYTINGKIKQIVGGKFKATKNTF